MIYRIEITETLQKIIDIEAESVTEALTQVEFDYRKEIINLSEKDLIDTEFKEVK